MKKLILIAVIIAVTAGCSKHPVLPSYGKASFNLNYVVDSLDLSFDTIAYTNDAGNQYSITKLEYYLSDFSLTKADGSKIKIGKYYYMNARNPAKDFFTIDSIPPGKYSGISFNIGLTEELNKTGALPIILENLNMAWPDPMGGGYHFLKMEGHFTDTATTGYAMHLGKNSSLINISLNHSMEIKYHDHRFQLEMNLNEWFRNPNTYNLSTDGTYTMGIASLMQKISENGRSVFSINTLE